MKMISPSNVSIDVGKTLNDKEYIGMCRREVFDDYLRKRAEANGTKLVNGQMLRMDEPTSPDGTYAVHFSNYDESEDGRTGKPDTIEVDIVIGADGANSRVAKEMGAGEYDYSYEVEEHALTLLSSDLDGDREAAELGVAPSAPLESRFVVVVARARKRPLDAC